MGTIRRLVLKNFKRFKMLELEFDPELNGYPIFVIEVPAKQTA